MSGSRLAISFLIVGFRFPSWRGAITGLGNLGNLGSLGDVLHASNTAAPPRRATGHGLVGIAIVMPVRMV